MPADNVRRYSIDWSENGGVSDTDHADYLKLFAADFYSQVKRLIDEAAAVEDEAVKVNSIDTWLEAATQS